MANHGDERVVVANATLRIAVDCINDSQRTSRLRRNAGFFDELAHRPLGDGLAKFEHAAGKPPAAQHRGVGAADHEYSVATQPHRQNSDDRAVRVAATLFAKRAPAPLRAHSAAALGRPYSSV